LYEFDYSAIFISASAEIVGLILVLFTVDRWGRVVTQTSTYLLGGVSCLLLGFCAYNPDSSRTLLVILAFLSRMAMMGASCTTWVSTSEILSTDIRATGHGAANAMSRFGGFFCPYIITQGTSLRWIGSFIFIVSLVTALFSWHLPETAGKALGEAHHDDVSKIHTHDDTKNTTTDGGTTSYQIL
jgi:putative MFS transporter